jgi:transketolase
MRTAFINELIAQARANPRIFLLVGDLGYSVVDPFAKEFPERFINMGVAEQNMTGVAAGLASEGFHVFIYSIANFPTFRCLEQIRNDVCYHRYPVTVVSVGGGLAYGNLGYSHHAVQDYAVMRCLNPLTIASPGDPVETAACVKWLVSNPQPSYLRLGKAGEPIIHQHEISLELGKTVEVKSGALMSGVFLTTGTSLRYAVEAIQLPELQGRWGVVSLPLWGEEQKTAILNELSRHKAIISVEDHLAAGGFGSYLREALADTAIQTRLKTVSLSANLLGLIGKQEYLNSEGGLDALRLVEAALSFSACSPSRLLN